MGYPVAHSKSPHIHRLFAHQTGQHLSYEAMLVEVDGFAAALRQFRLQGGRGVNVTVPFKQDAWRCMHQRSDRAERAGAVNTVSFQSDGSYLGDNTDGVGLVRDLTINHGVRLSAARVLLLGAGGAVRGVLEPILEQAPARLVIANRTVAKAQQLAQEFSPLGDLDGCGFDQLDGAAFDIVVNGSAASLHGELPSLPDDLLRPNACCYDMMYGRRPTPFMAWAIEHGAGKSIDGLGMLVEQAAESFYLWRHVRPQTGPVIAALRTRGDVQ